MFGNGTTMRFTNAVGRSSALLPAGVKLLACYAAMCVLAVELGALPRPSPAYEATNRCSHKDAIDLRIAQAGPLPIPPPPAAIPQGRQVPQTQESMPQETPEGIENPCRWYAAPRVTPLRPLTPLPMTTSRF
jgi:hypothetical protein